MTTVKTAVISTLGALTISFGMQAFASKSDCDQNSVFCAYITGLSSQLSDGRYIRLNTKYGSLPVMCVNNTTTLEIDKESAQFLGEGNVSSQIYICHDKSGTECEFVSDISTTITKTQTGYTASPDSAEINLHPYDKQFTHCDATMENGKKLLK